MTHELEQVGRLVPLKEDPELREEYVIYKDTITIGRHPSNNICLFFDSISRFHSRIECLEGKYVVIDLNSSNGTFVNGMRIQQSLLKDGDIIAFGDESFRFNIREAKKEEKDETQVAIAYAETEADTNIKKELDVQSTSLPAGELELLDPKALIEAHNRLFSLYRLSDLLRGVEDEQTMLERVVDIIFENLPADRGVILLRVTTEEERLEPAIVKYRDPHAQKSTETISISQTIVNKCVAERIAILSQDTLTDDRFLPSESIVKHRICSAMCVPLLINNRVEGVIHVDTEDPTRTFTEDDLSFLTSLANELAVSIENLRLREEMIMKERMAAIGQTITGIAHGVKNMLLLSKGGYELMERSIEQRSLESIQDCWRVIKSGVDRISHLTQDMLNFSSLRKPEKKEADINQLILDVKDSAQQELKKKNIELILNLNPNLPKWMADVDGLHKAITDLIVNATEAIKESQGEIEIQTIYNEKENYITIKFKDNGPGIAPNIVKKIFQPFFSTKGSKGTGLGLAMTKKIVESMGGKITVESEPGKGTIFTICLYSDETMITERR